MTAPFLSLLLLLVLRVARLPPGAAAAVAGSPPTTTSSTSSGDGSAPGGSRISSGDSGEAPLSLPAPLPPTAAFGVSPVASADFDGGASGTGASSSNGLAGGSAGDGNNNSGLSNGTSDGGGSNGGSGSGGRVVVLTGRELAEAFASPDVSLVVIGAGGVTLHDADWAGLPAPVEVRRNLTLAGPAAADIAAAAAAAVVAGAAAGAQWDFGPPEGWPLLDLNYLRGKVRLSNGVTFAMVGVVSAGARSAPASVFPGMDLLLPSPPGGPPAVAMLLGGLRIGRACYPPSYRVAAASSGRPEGLPGGPNAVIATQPQTGCRNDSESSGGSSDSSGGSSSIPMALRCWADRGHFIDVALDAYGDDAITGSTAVRQNYIVWLYDVDFACLAVLTADCIARLGSLSCLMLQVRAMVPPPPPPPPLPLTTAVSSNRGTAAATLTAGAVEASGGGPGGGGGSGGGAPAVPHKTVVALSVVFGALGGVLLAGGAALAVLLLRRRRLHSRKQPVPPALVSCSEPAASPSSSRAGATGPDHGAEAGVGALGGADGTATGTHGVIVVAVAAAEAQGGPASAAAAPSPICCTPLAPPSGGPDAAVSGLAAGEGRPPPAPPVASSGAAAPSSDGACGTATSTAVTASAPATSIAVTASSAATSTAVTASSTFLSERAAPSCTRTTRSGGSGPSPDSVSAGCGGGGGGVRGSEAAAHAAALAAAVEVVSPRTRFHVRVIAPGALAPPLPPSELPPPTTRPAATLGAGVEGPRQDEHHSAVAGGAAAAPAARSSSSSSSRGTAAAADELRLEPIALGRGAQGRVRVGVYLGARVAVKLLRRSDLLPQLPTTHQCAGCSARRQQQQQQHGREDGEEGAVKVAGAPVGTAAVGAGCSCACGLWERERDVLAGEVAVLGRCRHPNIVRLLAACLEPPRPCLVMELMETSLEALMYGEGVRQYGRGGDGGGDAGGIQQCGGAGDTGGGAGAEAPVGRLLPLQTVLYIALDVARALEFLHPTIAHRDVKPANVLINGGNTSRPIAKLADFGIARLATSTRETRSPEEGTPPYMAPEAFDPTNFIITHKVDMYAFGVLVCEMLTASPPWAGQDMLVVACNVALRGLRPPGLEALPADRCPARLRRLLLGCWEAEPDRRPAAAEAVKCLLLVLAELKQQGLGPAGVQQ